MSNSLRNATWDRLGIALSTICAIHCLLTPLVLLSVPMLARYYLVHPLFHWILAFFIVPVGVFSFLHGYKHHRKAIVLWLGIPGLVVISIVPILAHGVLRENVPVFFETALMILGSALLVTAHTLNRKACRNCEHHH